MIFFNSDFGGCTQGFKSNGVVPSFSWNEMHCHPIHTPSWCPTAYPTKCQDNQQNLWQCSNECSVLLSIINGTLLSHLQPSNITFNQFLLYRSYLTIAGILYRTRTKPMHGTIPTLGMPNIIVPYCIPTLIEWYRYRVQYLDSEPCF